MFKMLDKGIVDALKKRARTGDTGVLRSVELRSLFDALKTLDPDKKKKYGQEVNALRNELEQLVAENTSEKDQRRPIDVTAPMDTNTPPDERTAGLEPKNGSVHPLMSSMDELIDTFARMGFSSVESRQLDDDYHMFTSLNFPPEHPARDDYDSFTTQEGLIAPAHTSTMQNRVLREGKKLLDGGQPIAYIIPGRVFRNEDLDARHEHTFYQLEGVYVDKGVHVGMLISTLKTFLQEYYKQELDVKTQPYYFPFTEPSFEFAMSCPFCSKKGCSVCGYSGWIEILGCGMIHPNVLREAGINPEVYTGFAWGFGIDRLVMLKNDIEDVRHFHSGNLKFLRQF